MRYLGAVLLISLFFFPSCKNRYANPETNAKANDTTKFFQLNQYLQEQIKEVNATPFFIYKIDIRNGKKDSTPINTLAFNQVSNQFLTPDINDSAIKKYYKENIFEDQTTKGFTISYTTTNKALQLQNEDILLKEDGQTVKRILLRKYQNYPDSSAIEQLSWKPGESFQVNRSVQKGNVESSLQTTIVWNKKE
ncbi:MAG: hypothetical protein M3040_12745 [Bacteroidota bacterium]|nr:hypothetical protein [Bacteroidota bacterium]